MELRVLRYFLMVASEESISKAAQRLHITQPTLSRQLSQMEEEIGVTLFHRGTKKITLSEEGLLLARRAEEILSLVKKTEKELVEKEEVTDGRITIGCGEMSSVEWLTEIVQSFHQAYPQVTYDIITGTADEVKAYMDKGFIDIGLLLEPVNIEKYDFLRLPIQERWVVVMRPDDPLAQYEQLSVEDLCNVDLILPRRLSIQNELASWFGEAFHKLHILFTSNLSVNGAMMVQKGLGYLITLEGCITLWDQQKVTARPLYPTLYMTSVVAWKKQQPFSRATVKFINHIRVQLSKE